MRWDKLQDEGRRPKRIIELGTGHGALACYLAVFCKLHGIEFYTIDYYVKPGANVKAIFERLEVRYFDMPIFQNAGMIKSWIEKGGMTILLCDDGDKPKEYNLFAPSLKSGDIIMAHDWFESKQEFEETAGYRTAQFCEIELSDVIDTNKTQGLERYVNMQLSHWCCFIKR
jgi:predicted O-methyltransferase YrrM